MEATMLFGFGNDHKLKLLFLLGLFFALVTVESLQCLI